MLSTIETDGPTGRVARWLTAFTTLFEPLIAWLAAARDAEIARRSGAGHDLEAILEDRGLESVSHMEIDLDRQIAAVRAASSR